MDFLATCPYSSLLPTNREVKKSQQALETNGLLSDNHIATDFKIVYHV